MLSWRTQPKDPSFPPNSSNMGRNPPPPTPPECRRSLSKGTVTRDAGCTPVMRVAAPPPRRHTGDGGASPQRVEGIASRVRMDRISAWRRERGGGRFGVAVTGGGDRAEEGGGSGVALRPRSAAQRRRRHGRGTMRLWGMMVMANRSGAAVLANGGAG
jgi:hypothetical protein